MTIELILQSAALLALALGVGAVHRDPRVSRAALIAATLGTLALPALSWLPAQVSVGPVEALPWAAAADITLLSPLSEPVLGTAAEVEASSPSLWLWLWAAGMLLVGARHVFGWLSVAIARRRGQPAGAAWSRTAAVVGSTLPILQADVSTPLLVGILRPALLVPAWASELDTASRDQILRHELAHLRGADNLWLQLMAVLVTVQWFNPAVWLASRRLRLSCELVADDAVLTDGVCALAYADTLVSAARGSLRSSWAAWGAEPGLRTRVKHLVGARPSRAGRLRLAGGVVLVGSTAWLLGSSSVPSERPVEDTAEASAVGSEVAMFGLQSDVELELDRILERWDPRAAAIVVLDWEGAVVAEGEYLRDGEDVLGQAWPVGSMAKPFTAAAALSAGVDPEQAYDTTEVLQFGELVVRDHRPTGTADLRQVIARSSNVGSVALGEAVGSQGLADQLQAVGLPVSPGPWSEAERALVATGQGVSATPRQLASALSALDGRHPERVPSEVAAQVRSFMSTAVESGTGQLAALEDRSVAGKTGTARLSTEDGSVVASFGGLFPADEPVFTIVVMVIDPSGEAWGGTTAAPSFRRLAMLLEDGC